MRGQLVFHFLALSLHSYTTAKYMYVKDPNDRSIEQNTYWGGHAVFPSYENKIQYSDLNRKTEMSRAAIYQVRPLNPGLTYLHDFRYI